VPRQQLLLVMAAAHFVAPPFCSARFSAPRIRGPEAAAHIAELTNVHPLRPRWRETARERKGRTSRRSEEEPGLSRGTRVRVKARSAWNVSFGHQAAPHQIPQRVDVPPGILRRGLEERRENDAPCSRR
jgi:hypothetical protein